MAWHAKPSTMLLSLLVLCVLLGALADFPSRPARPRNNNWDRPNRHSSSSFPINEANEYKSKTVERETRKASPAAKAPAAQTSSPPLPVEKEKEKKQEQGV